MALVRGFLLPRAASGGAWHPWGCALAYRRRIEETVGKVSSQKQEHVTKSVPF